MGAYRYRGGWRFRFWNNGKLYERYGFESGRAAREAEYDLRRQLKAQGRFATGDDADLTLALYSERWLQQVKATVAPKTVQGYRGILEGHILPALGAVRLQDLTRGQVRDLLIAKRGAGLSKNTVRLIRATLSAMLADAVDDGLIPANPALAVGRSRRGRVDTVSPVERQQRIRPMTTEQLERFLDYAAWCCSQRDFTILLTLADTGLRPGEALALQWGDIQGTSIRVERALSGREVKPTKTREVRQVDITPRLGEALACWQRTATERSELPWLFHTEAGRLLDQIWLSRLFRKVAARAGLQGFRLYDLRHTYATHLLTFGAPPLYVAKQLGHAKVTTTLTWYAHWLPGSESDGWAKVLEERRSRDGATDWAGRSRAPQPQGGSHAV